nr:MAG TPA: hypothetical protein [Caudoviricetes sp.]
MSDFLIDCLQKMISYSLLIGFWILCIGGFWGLIEMNRQPKKKNVPFPDEIIIKIEHVKAEDTEVVASTEVEAPKEGDASSSQG